MDTLQIFVAVAASVILFLFGIEHFSREVQAISGARFRKFLATATRNRFVAFLLGGGLTAVIQSSTATSVIAVGLVNAGVLSFRHSLGVLFGANVGTTVTAQLVALELTSFAPVFILVGFAAGYMPFRWRILGRSIFYFGIVFFSLELVSTAVEPFKTDPRIIEALADIDAPLAAVMGGALFTAIVQSSTVTTGIAIVLLQQGIIQFDVALPLVLGANVGTTITALIASSSLDTSARRTAVSHAVYNIGGVLVFLPLLAPFEAVLVDLEQDPATTLAIAHFTFNAATASLFLALLGPFARLIERVVKDEAHEEALTPPPAREVEPEQALADIRAWLREVVGKLPRCYIAAVLALETRDKKIESRASRIVSIIRFAIEEGREGVYKASRRTLTAEESRTVLQLVVTLDHIRQITDSIDDIMAISTNLERRGIRLSMDALLDVQAVYPRAAKMLENLVLAFGPAEPRSDGTPDESIDQAMTALHTQERALTEALEACYLRFIEMSRSDEEGSDMADFLSIHQRLRSKILAFAEHLRDGVQQPAAPSAAADVPDDPDARSSGEV